MTISYRHQAEAVEVTMMEHRASIERYEKLPVGKGGIDEAAIKLKRMRLEALDAAQRTLHVIADRDEARRAAAKSEAAE